jgi:hypothetical protein
MADNLFDFSNYDLTTYLPGFLQDNPFYTDYLKATTKAWKEDVLPYVKKLTEIRQTIDYDTKEAQELWVLIRNANILGYKFLSDFMSQDNYLKLVDSISRFYELQGTAQTANFLGFVRAAKIQIKQLWSQIGINDYTSFEEKNFISSDTVVNYPGRNATGDWYPTSHYNIHYDLDVSGLLAEDVLKELFFSLSPINHVLNIVIAAIEFKIEKVVLDTEGGQEQIYPSVINTQVQNLNSSGDDLTFNGVPLTLGVII